MHTDFIARYKGAIPPEGCEEIKKHIEYLYNNSLLTGEERDRRHYKDDMSSNITCDYDDIDLIGDSRVAEEILNYMKPCIEDYLEEFSILSNSRFLMHDMKLKRIAPGGGFHNWHHENGTYFTAQRYFVVQAYLNDDFEGGETEFLYWNKREKAVAGDILIFPAGFTHTHRGNPPIGENAKYIATTWGWIQNEQ